LPSIRKITEIGDPLLRAKAQTVKRFDQNLHNILDDMACTLESLEGVGLAAPQIGISKRFFIVDVGEGVTEFINPQLIKGAEKESGTEGCFSIPGRQGLVERYKTVTVKAQDRYGQEFSMQVDGLFARALQHENDHLQGRLYIDIMTEELFD
jgi:peptide deformylase